MEFQYSVDTSFIHRVVRYCEEIVKEYSETPAVVIIILHECNAQILKKPTKNKKASFFFETTKLSMGRKMLVT
jgi:hypothetical protein